MIYLTYLQLTADVFPHGRYFDLEYAMWQLQENKRKLKLHGLNQVPYYTGDVNLLGDNTNIIAFDAKFSLRIEK
jgi:hypothetical protein